MCSYEFFEALDKLPIGLKIHDGSGGSESFKGMAVEFMIPCNIWIQPNDEWERIEGLDASNDPTRKFLPGI